jgi:hypothetical protein
MVYIISSPRCWLNHWPCTRHLDSAVVHVDIDIDAVTK